jgi:hypothetical protein
VSDVVLASDLVFLQVSNRARKWHVASWKLALRRTNCPQTTPGTRRNFLDVPVGEGKTVAKPLRVNEELLIQQSANNLLTLGLRAVRLQMVPR